MAAEPERRRLRAGIAFAAAAAAAACGLLPSAARAAAREKLTFEAGPRSITEEERRIRPDASRGAEHGVVLVDDTDRDESRDRYSRVRHHFRALILSNEGRDLANLEIPIDVGVGGVDRFWAFTLLPDGRVLELTKDDLQRQEIARSRGRTRKLLKGALPGVEPGCVIDYGWSASEPIDFTDRRVNLQGAWPVKQKRYRWTPFPGAGGAWRVARPGSLAVRTERDDLSVLVVARDLPATRVEPLMPPAGEVGTAVLLYYTDPTARDPRDYWDSLAVAFDRLVRSFTAPEKPTKDALAAIEPPAGAGWRERAEAVYAWIGANVRNASLLTREESEAIDPGEEAKRRRTVREVLESREGNSFELDLLFIGLARALGVEANLLLAPDRTERFYDPALLSPRQFGTTLVSVRAPGDPDEKALVVDPGSGLPFGDAPWWTTGVNGLLVTPKAARPMAIWPADPEHNRVETNVRLEPGAGATLRSSWTRTAGGQHAFRARESLRALEPEERSRRLEALCGGSTGLHEVIRAEGSDLTDPSAQWRLDCAIDVAIPAGEGGLTVPISGPWLGEVPELTGDQRANPVILDFPAVEHAVIEIAAPAGMVPGAAPPPRHLSSTYGEYHLQVSRTAAGFRAERLYALLVLGVPAGEHAPLRDFLASVRSADRAPVAFVPVAAPP